MEINLLKCKPRSFTFFFEWSPREDRAKRDPSHVCSSVARANVGRNEFVNRWIRKNPPKSVWSLLTTSYTPPSDPFQGVLFSEKSPQKGLKSPNHILHHTFWSLRSSFIQKNHPKCSILFFSFLRWGWFLLGSTWISKVGYCVAIQV